MPVEEGLEERIAALIEAAPSQAALAWLGGVSEGTLINWKRGLGYRESDMREFSSRTQISLDWLKEGKGKKDVEVAKVKDASRYEDRPTASSRVAADAPEKRGKQSSLSPREALRRARDGAGLSFIELGKRIGRDPGYLRALEEGNAPISENTADLICKVLPDLDRGLLLSGSDSPRIISDSEGTYGARPELQLPPGMTGRYVPLLSMAQAGAWDAEHSDGYYDYTAVFAPNVDDRRAFAIKVSGNSMEPEMREGDVVVCSPAASISNGDAAVVRTKSEQAFIKYWHRSGSKVRLESANPGYGPLEFPISEIAGAWPIIQRISSGKITKQL